ncbi:MAG: hypothetical protein IH804_08040, partial [Planctomycetes bacterium]|nr:hypothetical protein [Planctomycetota bacterium]
MPKYRIAWLPGDGVGNDVMEAAKIVLDRLALEAKLRLTGMKPPPLEDRS